MVCQAPEKDYSFDNNPHEVSTGFLGFPKNSYPFGGPHNKDYGTWGSILGSPYLGKLPYGFLVCC